jgi:hypothetical protein
MPPIGWGISASAHHLKNLYIYFWRWATLKVFGSGWLDATGEPESDRHGVICYITVAGFLSGPGFQRMRADLRRDASDIWIIDCSPEGHQPDVPTRVFQDVQQPVCIVLAARATGKDREQPARVRYLALPEGRREAKFEVLSKLSLAGEGWKGCASGWREPFLPERGGQWASFPSLSDLFVWSSPGVKTHRTWIISPDAETLGRRWDRLRNEKDAAEKDKLFHSDDTRNVRSVVRSSLGAYPAPAQSVAVDEGPILPPIRYGFRSFDRQWLPPDPRLVSRARPKLWALHSSNQIFLTALEAHSPSGGPAITLTALIPDNDYYKGSFGGRILPLWRDAAATQANIQPEFLSHLTLFYGAPIPAEDVMAYLAAVMAHPAFTARFADDLIRPGLRVPLTANRALFDEAVALGREVVWPALLR